MPNINFSAPVIRLGTSGPPKSGAEGAGGGRKMAIRNPLEEVGGEDLGSARYRGGDPQRQQLRENMIMLQPPTGKRSRARYGLRD